MTLDSSIIRSISSVAVVPLRSQLISNPSDVTASLSFILFIVSFSFISLPSFLYPCEGAVIVSVSIIPNCILWVNIYYYVFMVQRVHLGDIFAKRSMGEVRRRRHQG